MRLEDLPENLRAQVLAKDNVRKPKDRRGATRVATDGWCECGERFTSTGKWERHSDAGGAGHRRFELIGALTGDRGGVEWGSQAADGWLLRVLFGVLVSVLVVLLATGPGPDTSADTSPDPMTYQEGP